MSMAYIFTAYIAMAYISMAHDHQTRHIRQCMHSTHMAYAIHLQNCHCLIDHSCGPWVKRNLNILYLMHRL